MGGKSKSSSSTLSYNYNYDERIGASDNAVVYSNNIDGNNNTVTDMGAIASSFEFSTGVVDKAFSSINDTVEKSLDFADTSQARSFQALNDNTRLAFEFANNATVTADERVVNKLLPLLIVGAVVVGLAIVMKGRK